MAFTPLYLRMADDLREKIASRRLAAGAALPSISALCRDYGVSASVVRSAMLVLKAEGLVEGHQGKGVYVAERP